MSATIEKVGHWLNREEKYEIRESSEEIEIYLLCFVDWQSILKAMLVP